MCFSPFFGLTGSELVLVAPVALESVDWAIGAWPIEVEIGYQSARVVGIDLAPVQPEIIPTNCEFVIGDAIVELLEFHDCSADLINSRYGQSGLRSSSQY